MSAPEWVPPPELEKPVMRRLPVSKFEWERAVSGRLPRAHMPTAWMLSIRTDGATGEHGYPGEVGLAAAVQMSTRAVRDEVAWLDTHGWVDRVAVTNRRAGIADEYRLTVPAPVAVELGMWPEGEPQWIEWRPEFTTRPWSSNPDLRPPRNRPTTGSGTSGSETEMTDYRKQNDRLPEADAATTGSTASAHQPSYINPKNHHSCSSVDERASETINDRVNEEDALATKGQDCD